MNERINEFSQNGKQFIYFDLSDFQRTDDYRVLIVNAMRQIAKYPDSSVYTLTNIHNAHIDSLTKKIVADWMKYNRQYVKFGAVFGVDGIKRVLLNSVFALSRRSNMACFRTREQALIWLLEQNYLY